MITALHKDYASHIQEQKNKIMFLLLSFSIFKKKIKGSYVKQLAIWHGNGSIAVRCRQMRALATHTSGNDQPVKLHFTTREGGVSRLTRPTLTSYTSSSYFTRNSSK